MADWISAGAYVLTVWLFALHLIFDRRFRRRLRQLAWRQYRLERRLEAMSRQDTWVVGNSQFSHAPWVLVCLSGSHYRVAARHFRKQDLIASQVLFATAVPLDDLEPQSRVAYRGCFDLYGVFADVGSYGSLRDLSEDGCRLLKLGFPVILEPEPEVVPTGPVAPPVVYPEVVAASCVLPPLFLSRFN